MKINIIDPGMLHYAGHHADINLRLHRLFVGKGCDVHLYGHREFLPRDPDRGLNIHSHFSLNPYFDRRIVGKTQRLSPARWSSLVFDHAARVFGRELRAIEPGDLCILPTAFSYQLTAIGHWADSRCAIVCCLHNAPDWENAKGNDEWRQALGNGRWGGRLRLGVLEPALLPRFEALLQEGVSISTLPIPQDGTGRPFVPPVSFSVGLLGVPRPAKRDHEVLEVAVRLAQRGFRVMVQDATGCFGAGTMSDERIKILPYVDDMGELVQQCSVVLLNYDVDKYRHSGSGIAWQAIASGVPMVVPSGTTMARLVGDSGSGRCFDPADTESKYRELQALADDYPTYVRKAALARVGYRQRHGAARLVDYLLNQGRSETGPERDRAWSG